MRKFATIRYIIAVSALILGFVLSVSVSERGFLFDPQGAPALAASESGEASDYNLRNLQVLNSVLLYVRDSYVEPERIEPQQMLVHALDGVQSAVPEIVTLFNRAIEDDPTEVEIRVGAHTREFSLGPVDSLWSMSFKLREVFQFIEEHIDPSETELPNVEYAAINGLLRTLDPHSVLLTPRIYEDMQASNRGSFGGLGIVVSIRDGDLTVISPIDDTPASRAGLRPGDRIMKINDESTINMPLDEAVSRLRGAPATSVDIEVMRADWSEPHQFTLEREIISIQSVKHHALGDGIGYVSVSNFQQTTTNDLRDALREMGEEMGELRGLVLDLRNNPGGLLNQAVRMTDLFLGQGTIVTTVGVGDRLREENVANARDTQPDYPIIVLVNEGSASASEIVAGALKAHNRAVVLGDRTFGKGSVQLLHELRDSSALKLTIAEYLTPGDISIQGHGIVPDILAMPVSVSDRSIDLYPSERVVREGSLETRMTGSSRRNNGDERPSSMLRYVREATEPDAEMALGEEDFEMDFEIDVARQIIAASGGTSERTALLGRATEVLDRVSAEQMLEVQELLRQRNVDWSAGDNVIQPVALEVSLDRTSNRVRAGEEVRITLSATNRGDRTLSRVRALSRSDYRVFDDREFVFGRLEPGETREWTVNVNVPVEDASRLDRVQFAAFADEIDLESKATSFIEVEGEPRPHWGFSYSLDDMEGGNGDGRLQVGETVRMHVNVHNTGEGDARKTMVYLRNRSDAAVFLREGRDEFEQIYAGGHESVQFEFDVRQVPDDGLLRLSVEIFDTVFREYVAEELTFEVMPADVERTVRERPGRLVVSNTEAAIYTESSADSTKAAVAPPESVLPVERHVDGWYFVRWGESPLESGWVAEEAGAFDGEEAEATGEIQARMQFHAPRIRLSSSALRTSDPFYDLEGEIEGDREVRDFYVSVFNRPDLARPQASKRAYRYLGVQSAPFSERLELRTGMNRISITARDSDRISSSRVIYVYRDEE